MAKKNVVRRDVVQIGFEIEKSPVAELENCIKEAQGNAKKMADNAENAAKKVASIGDESEKAVKKTSKVGKSAKKVTEEVSEIGKEAKKASDKASSIGDEAEKASKKTKPLKDGIGGVGDEADKAKKKTEGLGEGIGGLGEGLGDLIGKGKSLAVVFAGAAAAFSVGKLIDNVSEVDQAMNKLAAQTGASGAEMESYRKSVQSLYNGGTGESIGEVADAMALVRQQFKELDDGTMKSVTNDAMVLADTFDMDLNETLRGVNSLMVNMGLTADEAFDYIAKGAQNGLDKSGELADNIAEYSQLWAQAGFSAEEMFTILQNGLDSGAYNLDKVNDFVKEFSISLSDGRIAENIGSFSQETQQLFESWKSGGASQKEVFSSIISDLSSMTNQQEALTIASNVWSSLGEDNAMKVITSLNNVNDTYSSVKGTMESINDVRYDDLQTSMDKVSRSASGFLNETFAPAVSVVNDVIITGIDKVTEFAQEHETLSTAFSAAALTAAALAVGVGGVVAAGQLLPPLITKISASFAVMNLSMGPVGIALLGISAGVGLVTAAVKLSDDEIEDYDGTLEECSHEIEITAEAHKKAAARYGENSEAAKKLEKNLDTLNAQYQKGGGYMAELQEKIQATSEAFENLKDSQDEAMNSIDNTEIQGYQAVSMLEALSQKANLTSADLDAMSKYADYLNDTFNCNIVVDYDTGKLTGFDPTVVAQQIVDMSNDNKVKQAMEFLSGADFTTNMVDTIKAVNEAEAEYAQASADRAKAAQMSGFMGDEEKRYQDSLVLLEEVKRQAEPLYASLKENADIVDPTGELYETLRKSFEQTAESGDEFISSISDSSEELENQEEYLTSARDAVSGFEEDIISLAQAYDEAYEAAQESVAGQYEVWDSVGEIAETSVSDLQAALQSQSDYWSSYSDNLTVLQEKARGIEGLSDMIATMADGSEDSASAIAALAGASDEELQNIASNWQSVKQEQDNASQSIADTATQFSVKMDEMGVKMQGLVDEMDMGSVAQAKAANTVNAFVNTMLSTINARQGEVHSAMSNLMSGSSNLGLNINIPGNASGTTNSEDVFVAGEQGAELIVGKKGSTVFPASETNKIVNAVQDYAGSYQPETSNFSKIIESNTTYAPQFTLNLNGASATESNKRTVKRWVKESLNEVFNNLADDISPVVEV